MLSLFFFKSFLWILADDNHSVTTSEHLEQIVKYVSMVPEAGCDDAHRIKFPQICCEILSAKIWTITEALFANPELLKLIIGFLESDPTEANEEQAKVTKNCSKIVSSIMNVRKDDFVSFMQTVPHCVEGLVRHMSNPCIMAILQKLITISGQLVSENDATNVCSLTAFLPPPFFCCWNL